MNQSLIRYLHETADQNGQPLFWSSVPGVNAPYRGTRPLFLNSDEAADRTAVTYDFHVQRFCMDDADDREAYRKVMERIVNGRCQLVDRREFSRNEYDFIHLEWAEPFAEPIPARFRNDVLMTPS